MIKGTITVITVVEPSASLSKMSSHLLFPEPLCPPPPDAQADQRSKWPHHSQWFHCRHYPNHHYSHTRNWYPQNSTIVGAIRIRTINQTIGIVVHPIGTRNFTGWCSGTGTRRIKCAAGICTVNQTVSIVVNPVGTIRFTTLTTWIDGTSWVSTVRSIATVVVKPVRTITFKEVHRNPRATSRVGTVRVRTINVSITIVVSTIRANLSVPTIKQFGSAEQSVSSQSIKPSPSSSCRFINNPLRWHHHRYMLDRRVHKTDPHNPLHHRHCCQNHPYNHTL